MYGPLYSIILYIILFAIILAGVYLCKYDLKYIAISTIGLILLAIYLLFSLQGVIIELQNIHERAMSLLVEYALPVTFFALSSITITRWGMQKLSLRSNKINPQSPFIFDHKKTWQSLKRWFARPEDIAILVLTILILTFHLIYISNPSSMMGDEVYYISEANRILHGLPLLLLEHPPLGKWFIAAGILLFGNNAMGWRIFPIVFGTASIFIFYLLCQTLVRRSLPLHPTDENSGSSWSLARWSQPGVFVPVLATFLFATDTLSFSQAQMAMLDVFALTLMLLGFLFYLRRKYLFAGTALGLAMLCKETALFGVLAIFLHWVITRRLEIFAEFKYIWQGLKLKVLPAGKSNEILPMARLLAAVPATWFLLLPLLEYVRTPLWGKPFARIFYIYWHSLILLPNSGFKFKPGIFTSFPPWEWLFHPDLQNFNFVHAPNYLTTIGWAIWALIIPAITYLLYQAIRKRFLNPDAVIFSLFWFLTVYGSLVAAELSVGRDMYTFYFYPAIPALCLAIAWGCWKLRQAAHKKEGTRLAFIIVFTFFLVGTLASFIIMSPLGTGLIKLPA